MVMNHDDAWTLEYSVLYTYIVLTFTILMLTSAGLQMMIWVAF